MNKIKWTALAAVLGLLLCLCLCACTDGGATTSEPETSRTSRTTRRVIDVQIESLITREEISEAMSFPVGEPVVTHNGTHLYVLSEDGTVSIQIALDKQTAEQFAKMVGETSSAETAPNLGQQAWWLADKGMLLVYQGTYTLSVSISGADYSSDDALFVSRQLAVPILEKLQA